MLSLLRPRLVCDRARKCSSSARACAPEVRTSLLAYYAAVGRMDGAIGEAVSRLDSANLLDDTVVVYTGDNGWQFPRGLANCYDTGCRVPLAIRWGKKLPSGRIVDDFVSHADFAPTFLELAGLEPPAAMTGATPSPMMRIGPMMAPPPMPVSPMRTPVINPKATVRGSMAQST